MSKVYKSDYINLGSPKAVVCNVIPINNYKKEEYKDIKEQKDELQEIKLEAEFIIAQAKKTSENLIAEAKKEAEQIILLCQNQSEQLRIEEKKRGYQEGYQEGYSEGRKNAKDMIDEAIQIKDYLDNRKIQILNEIEHDVVRLVLGISKKVIGDELIQNKDGIFSIIKQALKKCNYKKNIIIRVCDNDFEYVDKNIDLLKSTVEGLSEVQIIKDESLKKGSCIVESSGGEINSSIEAQMKELEKMFLFMARNEW